jgi:hypothetical protein
MVLGKQQLKALIYVARTAPPYAKIAPELLAGCMALVD